MAEPTTEERTFTAKDIANVFEAYHVPTTHGAIEQMVGDAKEFSPAKFDAITEHVKTQAASLYPTLAKQISEGVPVAAMLEPYRQVGKQVFGSDFEPNFQTDPKMRAALEGSTDPATGRSAPMGLTQWAQYLKTEPSLGYMETPQGQAERTAMMNRINNALSGQQ